MKAKETSQALAKDAESICRLLLPNGKKVGNEWEAGSIHGEEGNSLKVHLTGDKAGIWSDFAIGGEHSGDLLDLWRLTASITLVEAIKQARDHLGLSQGEYKRKPYPLPNRPKGLTQPKSKTQSFLQARGFTPETIAKFKIGEANQERSVCFPYIHNGIHVHTKYCTPCSKEQGRTWESTAHTMPCLFGWQAVDEDNRQVVIVEGEFDALTLSQMGFNALSVPRGGGKGDKQNWVENEMENLDCMDEIILALDNDQAGKEAEAEIANRLGAHRCKIAHWPKGIKDANDALKAGWSKQQFDDVINAADHAKMPGIAAMGDFTDDIIEEFYPSGGRKPGIRTPWEERIGDNLVFRDGELTIWTGFSGEGKTEILGHVAVDTVIQKASICVASMEMQISRACEGILKQSTAMGQPSKEYLKHCIDYFSERLFFYNILGTAKGDEILKHFRYVNKCFGTKMFIVDSLTKCGIAEDDYTGQKVFVESLIDFAHETNSHIHLVAHQRKPDKGGQASKHGVRGAVAITDVADNVCVVSRNSKKERQVEDFYQMYPKDDLPDDLKKTPDTFVHVEKQRKGGWTGHIFLWFNRDSRQFLVHPWAKSRMYIPYSGQPKPEISNVVEFKIGDLK